MTNEEMLDQYVNSCVELATSHWTSGVVDILSDGLDDQRAAILERMEPCASADSLDHP